MYTIFTKKHTTVVIPVNKVTPAQIADALKYFFPLELEFLLYALRIVYVPLFCKVVIHDCLLSIWSLSFPVIIECDFLKVRPDPYYYDKIVIWEDFDVGSWVRPSEICHLVNLFK